MQAKYECMTPIFYSLKNTNKYICTTLHTETPTKLHATLKCVTWQEQSREQANYNVREGPHHNNKH
jgi:hypothetical protein